MSSAAKLDEARFFLELLQALEQRNRPLTRNSSVAREVSFLFSSVLNSIYAALEQAKPKAGVDAVKAYKSERSSLFGGNGVRNTTIHEKHVDVDHAGYVPPPGDAVNLVFRRAPLLIEEQDSRANEIVMGPSHYIEYDGRLTEVTEICSQQINELSRFLRLHGVVA